MVYAPIEATLFFNEYTFVSKDHIIMENRVFIVTYSIERLINCL